MARAKAQAPEKPVSVQRGNVDVVVVDTGIIAPNKTVEVKSRVEGRLKNLYVTEGDRVKSGQVVAVIDPQETQLQVAQNQAQLAGAQSAYNKAALTIQQRRVTAHDDLVSANLQLSQLKEEANVQPELTRSLIAQAKSQVSSTKADLAQLVQSSIPTQRAASTSALKSAQANVANSKAEESRDAGLLKRGYISQKTYEDAQLQLQVSQANQSSAYEANANLEDQFKQQIAKAQEAVTAAQEAYDSAVANSFQNNVKKQQYFAAITARDRAVATLQDVPILEQDKAQSAATVQQTESVLRDSQRLLGYTEVKSPMDGVVALREIQEGELVASLSSFSSGTPILRIEDRSKMKVTLDVNEIDVAKMRLGMRATVTIDALPGETFIGTVSKINPSSEASSSSTSTATTGSAASSDVVVKYAVEIELDHPTPDLKTGMSAKCTLNVQSADNVLYIPMEYLGHDAQGNFVMLAPVVPKGKAVRQAVIPGLSNGSNVEIKQGLTEGQKIVRPAFNGPSMKGMMQFGAGS